MKKLTLIILTMLLVSTIDYGLSTSYAAIPHLISYQGKLTDGSGKPIDQTPISVKFTIYDASNTNVWSETQTVTPAKGLFSVMLGSVNPINNLLFNEQYTLGIRVGSDTSDLSPRQPLSSVGYAFRAENADNATNAVQAQKIEARTSDPASPTPGQMWLRTDL